MTGTLLIRRSLEQRKLLITRSVYLVWMSEINVEVLIRTQRTGFFLYIMVMALVSLFFSYGHGSVSLFFFFLFFFSYCQGSVSLSFFFLIAMAQFLSLFFSFLFFNFIIFYGHG